jgi:hypothetical protein
MRNPTEIKDRIQLAIIEEINSKPLVIYEIENFIPVFVNKLTNKLTELCLDEISFGRKS